MNENVKIGDMVKVVRLATSGFDDNELTVGNIYEVGGFTIASGYPEVRGDDGEITYLLWDQFEIITNLSNAGVNVGDQVEVTSLYDNLDKGKLHVGGVYEVTGVRVHDEVNIIDDNGDEHYLSSKQFKVVAQNKTRDLNELSLEQLRRYVQCKENISDFESKKRELEDELCDLEARIQYSKQTIKDLFK